MEKRLKHIKYLLGFLVVGAGLFINQSFAGLLVDYQSTTNRNLSFSLYCHRYQSSSYYPSYFAGSFSLVNLDQGYRYDYNSANGENGTINHLNFSDYVYLSGGLSNNVHYCAKYGYLYSIGDSVGLIQTDYNNNMSVYSYYFRLTNPGVGFSESNLISFSGYDFYYDEIITGVSVGNGYLHVLSDDNLNNCFSINTPYDGNCYSSQFEFHPFNGFDFSAPTITDQGFINDNIIDGLYFNKGGISYSIYNTYSFVGIHYDSTGDDWSVVSYDILAPRTVFRKNETTVNFINGVYYTRLNNSDPILTDNQAFNIVAFYGSGSSNSSGYSSDANVLYSIYNCPYNADSVFDCTFSKGGYVYSGSDLASFKRFFYQLSSPTTKLINVYDSTGNIFTIIDYNDNKSSTFTYSYSLGLNEGFDINNSIGSGNDPLPPIPDEQSTGSIAINSGLLNLCLNDLQFGELNFYLCNQLLSNLGYPVQIPGTSGQYISVSIDENGNLRYWITTQEDLAQQMSGFIWVENEDGTRSTVCPSGNCLGTVLAQPINHGNTGFELSTGVVLDMITNLTGWVGRCPFPYTDFRLGKNIKLLQLLQDYGFKYDPFVFINCIVAGFHDGRHTITIDNKMFDDIFEHPLIYGDTDKHKVLFSFLDFVVILGIFGLVGFFKKIF